MSFEVAHSVKDLVSSREAELQSLLARGDVQPLFLHYYLILGCLLLGPLIISSQTLPSIRKVRLLSFGLIAILGSWMIFNCRTLSLLNGTGIGATSALIMRSFSLMVCNDIEKDFQRLEKRRYTPSNSSKPAQQHLEKSSKSEVKNRTDNQTDEARYSSSLHSELETSAQNQQIVWQGYPESFKHRLDWVLSLIIMPTGFFQVWNFDRKHHKRSHPDIKKVSTPEILFQKTEKGDIARFMRQKLTSLIMGYALFDVLQFLMVHDSYFQGYDDLQGPTGRFNIFLSSSLGLSVYRCVVSMLFFPAAFCVGGSFCAFVLLGTSLIFPEACNSITSLPLSEFDCYADYVVGPISAVYATGLTGFWGTYYHQFLRFDFVSCSRWVLSFFPKGSPSYERAKPVISIAIPFLVSGLVHAAGSFTHYASTRPIGGVVLWNMLQPLGIYIQHIISSSFRWPNGRHQSPTTLEKGVNLFFALAWFIYTGPILFDEYAKGGIWQLEFFPVNVMIGLGFSEKTKGWWRWNWDYMRIVRLGVWHGERWWQRGIYFF